MKKVIYVFALSNLLVIFYFWLPNSNLTSTTAGFLISLGRLFGLLAVYFVLLQFLLIGRAPWLEKVFGLDQLSRMHHLNGFLSIFFITLHPVFLSIGYGLVSNTGYINQLLLFLTNFEDVLGAFVAVILFITIIFFSIHIVRAKLKYEAWYFIHLLNYLAIFFAWGHQLKNGADFQTSKLFVFYWYGLYAVVFGNHLVFRFLRPLYLFNKHKFFVEKTVEETPDSTSVYISGENLKDFKIEPGQFMILRFLSKKLWWQAHPFSLSRAPNGKNLRVTIKNVGDFTSQIGNIKNGTRVIIDGPYGKFIERHEPRKILLIAGGIGITPIIALIEAMSKHKKDIVVLYGNKQEKDIVFKKELDRLRKRYKFPSHFFLSKERKKGFEHGRIDKPKVAKLVEDVQNRSVYICGPVPMMDDLKKDLIELGVKPSRICFEKFSL